MVKTLIKNSSVTNITKSISQPYKTGLKIVLILLLLLAIFIVINKYGKINTIRELFNNQSNSTSPMVQQNASISGTSPIYFGNYIQYTTSPTLSTYDNTTDNAKRFIYTFNTNMRIDTIGLIFCGSVTNSTSITVSYIGTDNIMHQVGDINSSNLQTATLSNLVVPQSSSFNVDISKIVATNNTFGYIYRVPRNENGNIIVTKSIIVTMTDPTAILPCELLRNMCFFGFPDDPNNYNEYTLYYNDIVNNTEGLGYYAPSSYTNTTYAISSISTDDFNAMTSYIPTTNPVYVDNYLAYTLDNSNNPQLNVRFLRFTLDSTYITAQSIVKNPQQTTTTTTTTVNPCSALQSFNTCNVMISYTNALSGGTYINLPNYILFPELNDNQNNNNYQYIYFPVPILVSKIIIKTDNINQIIFDNIEIVACVADNNFIQSYTSYYNQVVQAVQNNQNFAGYPSIAANNNGMQSDNVCPSSVTDIINHQNIVQQICDSIEYQDNIKAQKVKLEREKQYLSTLKQQYDQIKDLQTQIDQLQSKRDARQQINDNLRLAQYQQQKSSVARIRDIASGRSAQHDNNVLNIDVNLQQLATN